MYLGNYGLQKTWLEKCLKGPVSEHPSTINMLKGPKHCLNLPTASLSYFFITLGGMKLGNVSLSDI